MTLANAACSSRSSSHVIPGRSRWLVGSSSSRMSGCCTRASTIARRFCQPPDNSVACASRSSKPARPRVSAKRAPRSVPETPQRSRALSITERTVAPGWNRESCSTQARRVRFRNDTSPLSGATSPARIRRRVDLPDPFGPIRPMRSPSEMVNETFWKSGFAPKAFVISCALTMGGNEVRSPRDVDVCLRVSVASVAPLSRRYRLAGNALL